MDFVGECSWATGLVVAAATIAAVAWASGRFVIDVDFLEVALNVISQVITGFPPLRALFFGFNTTLPPVLHHGTIVALIRKYGLCKSANPPENPHRSQCLAHASLTPLIIRPCVLINAIVSISRSLEGKRHRIDQALAEELGSIYCMIPPLAFGSAATADPAVHPAVKLIVWISDASVIVTPAPVTRSYGHLFCVSVCVSVSVSNTALLHCTLLTTCALLNPGGHDRQSADGSAHLPITGAARPRCIRERRVAWPALG